MRNTFKTTQQFILALAASLIAGLPAAAAPSDIMSEFDAYRKQQQQQSQQIKDEFKAYRKKLRNAFDTFRKKTGAVWGNDNVMPRKTNWVSFQNDINQRSVVDFEKGTVNVEIALPLDRHPPDQQIQQKLKDNIITLLNQHADTRSMPEIAKQPVIKPDWQPEQKDQPPVLDDQVADEKGNNVTPDNYDMFAGDLASKAIRKTIRGNDGQQRIVYEAQFRLVPDHIKKRARRYQKKVNTNATEQSLEPELIFAVIETESMFNPTARSPAPAFGLMQLVPTSGARDAYRYLYNKDRIVTDTYLYNPDNNIKLGSAFLHRLYYDYFNGITSRESRLWATIAAYNTGAGNVYRSFAGKYTRARFGNRQNWKHIALREINQRTPEQVYLHMKAALPYRETRSYIQKVRTRMNKYRGTGQTQANAEQL